MFEVLSFELLGRGQTDAVVAVVIPAVDVETIRIEVADVDAVTARSEITATNVDAFEQALAGGQEVQHHGVDHRLSGGCVFVLGQQRLLLGVGLADGVVHRCLPNQFPADFAGLRSELLVVVPVLTIEDFALAGNQATDLDDRGAEVGYQQVGVLAGFEFTLGERHFGQGLDDFGARSESEMLGRLFDAEHVRAHDGTGTFLRCRRRKAAGGCECGQAIDEGGVGVDSIDDLIGVVSESNPETLFRGIEIAGGDLCPFHGRLLSLLTL